MYDDTTQEPQSQRQKCYRENKQDQYSSHNSVPIIDSTTKTSSGLSVRIHKRLPSADNQQPVARESPTASVSSPPDRFKSVADQLADMNVSGSETTTVPLAKGRSKRYITHKNPKSARATNGEELLRKAVNAPEFRPISQAPPCEVPLSNDTQSTSEPSIVNKAINVSKSASMSPTSSNHIMQSHMSASIKPSNESPVFVNAVNDSAIGDISSPESNDMSKSQNIMAPVISDETLQPQIDPEQEQCQPQHENVYRPNSYQRSLQFAAYPALPPVISESSNPSMTVHPMMTSSGQILLMTESGLMVASTPDAFGGYDLYSTGGYYPQYQYYIT
jgi:hypothetical protein